jgi:hypothetical protein
MEDVAIKLRSYDRIIKKYFSKQISETKIRMYIKEKGTLKSVRPADSRPNDWKQYKYNFWIEIQMP